MKQKKLLALLLLVVFSFCVLVGCDNEEIDDPEVIQLTTPVTTVESNVVTWQAVEHATEYEVFVDGESVGKQTQLTYTLTKTDVGSYVVTVKALSNDEQYSASEPSQGQTITIEPGQLLKPIVHATGLTFSWTAITHASGYEVYVDGAKVATQTELSYTLVPTEYKTYSVTVKAVSDSANFISSEMSSAVIYEHKKPMVSAPILEVVGESITWLTSDKVACYQVYLDGEFVTTVTTGEYSFSTASVGSHSIYVKAIANNSDEYDDNQTSPITVTIEAVTDLSKPIYVYSKNLADRLGKYVLGIADSTNYSSLSDGYKSVLDSMMDNYLCNMPTSSTWTDTEYAKYAWKLEEVTYDMTKTWVHADAKVYRIRLADGMYLTVAKNNVIGSLDGDYVCESEYVENDIWQYWQFIEKAGCKNQYYIYNVGHGYDWGHSNDYLTDTSRNNGGAELYPMTSSNENYFPYIVKNVEGATFDEIKHNDYSGNYLVSNFINGNCYAPATDGVIRAATSADAGKDGTAVWTLEKVEGKNAYKVKFVSGKYMCMGGYDLVATDAAGAQEFYITEVAGLKNGFKISGGLDSDFCIFLDTNDGLNRLFVYSDPSDGKPSRQWGSIDWRNEMGRYFIFTAYTGELPIASPVVTNSDNVFSWSPVANASSYEVYVNGTLADTITETSYTLNAEDGIEYSITVKALTAVQGYKDSAISDACVYKKVAPVALDFSKAIFAYNSHLEGRYAKCALGIADSSNYSTLSASYQATLDAYVDNYLCNIVIGTEWTDADYAKYAWKLEEVTYDMTKSWVYADAKVYRIRLVDGFYLTVAKNNVIGTSGDYICESEYVENDIWQYWQFIAVDGKKDTYNIYNVGHGYDWNKKNDFVVDSTSSDGHAEFYPKDASNAEWFEFVLSNIDDVTFAEAKHNDYRGNYVVKTLINANLYAPNEDSLIVATDHTSTGMLDTDVWTLEKVEGKNTYKVKFADGKYMCMSGYDLVATDAAGAQEFYITEVAGLKNGFKISGGLDGDFCIFLDTNDGLNRLFVYSDPGDGKPTRQWGSIDWRNDMGRYYVFTVVEE